MHACENEMVYKSTSDKVPYFNAGAFLENKTRIGKVDEILGSINEVMFTVKPDTGVSASSFQAGDKELAAVDVVVPAVDVEEVVVEAVEASLDVVGVAVDLADVVVAVVEASEDVEEAVEVVEASEVVVGVFRRAMLSLQSRL
ncbi:H/ACA ribonucleoprotein complex subunit [Phytophthora palmivora]|uniref:H/ACA ribonucleoprotein complex subunit n=1 Tax=Phytophthora palmivora TaxID=4796 RepID=A0A2P4XJ35_9STRA|nr:H/ACA ribonucleoprotein complex subunit [Phytophthora palmivora]